MVFHREVIGQFHCKLLLSLEIAKTEAGRDRRAGQTERKTIEFIVI